MKESPEGIRLWLLWWQVALLVLILAVALGISGQQLLTLDTQKKEAERSASAASPPP